MKTLGYIVQESSDLVGIVTLGSNNAKTGNVDTLWILYRHCKPTEARKQGHDAHCCGRCPLRDGRCYVNLGQAPRAIWEAYKRGKYAPVGTQVVPSCDTIRLGGYGDPAMLNKDIVIALAKLYKGTLGYTHQWRKASWLKPYCMASCDNAADVIKANKAGWSMFGVRELIPEESYRNIWSMICSNEHSGRKCADCGICGGNKGKSPVLVTIGAHGAVMIASLKNKGA